MDVPDDLTVLWDGQLLGRVRVTDKQFDPAKRFNAPTSAYVQPARWWIKGSFAPAPLFDRCRPAFDESNRLACEYDEGPDSGDEMIRAEEAMREALLGLAARVRIPELDGKLHRIDIEDGSAAIILAPSGAAQDAVPGTSPVTDDG